MRNLTEKEIATLTVFGCTAEDWKKIRVHTDFNPAYCAQVHFSGENTLGKYDKVFELAGGLKTHSGIYNTILHNCKIGNDVYINHIHNYLANYKIGDNSFIEHVDEIVCTGESLFGNGTEVNVMIESGQRAIPIFEDLSNVMAYLMTFYRHLPEFTNKLLQSAGTHIHHYASTEGEIGANTTITNSGSIRNVRIGDNAEIRTVSKLWNGTICSNAFAPVYIGTGVIAEDFIVQSGASIDNGSMVSKCLIGQGTKIDKQFSAIDSLFFANCQGFHGEAVSIFAGPFTVSHHRSTLLLASLYSFYNAGSGTNFSNHMYKSGPVHQGVTERGVKTSSNSYLMWPARIGAFNVVLGSHKGNPDLSNLPFSYLMEVESESVLVPGINFQSAGTSRDIKKWADRDARKDKNLLDIYQTDLLNPYLILKMLKGQQILRDLMEKMDPTANFVWYQNCKIKKSSLKKGIEIYENAIDIYLFDLVGKVQGNIEPYTLNLQDESLRWVDLAGMFTSSVELNSIIHKFVSEDLTIQELMIELQVLNTRRTELELEWNKKVFSMKLQDKESIIAKGEKAKALLEEMIARDFKKEFNSTSRIGFGIDGDETVRDLDFDCVRK